MSSNDVLSGMQFEVQALALLLAASTLMIGCDEQKQPKKPKNIPDSVKFEVDAEGVYYRYRKADGTMTSAQSLAQIPLAARPAVAVHVTGKTPTTEEAGGYYVANLLEASSGDSVTAIKRKPIWLNRAGRATDRAARIALGLKHELTPEPDKKQKNNGMGDHEVRDRQIDITQIKGSERKANLFNEVADAGSTDQKVDKVKKIIGSDREPGPRRTDGRPAPQHAPESDQPDPGVSDDQPSLSGEESSTGESGETPSREEINRQLDKARESGRMPEGAEQRIQQQRQ